MERLDSVWDGLAFDAPWKSRQEKESARAALERFLRWHVMQRGEGREGAVAAASRASTSRWRPGSTRSASAAAWTAWRATPRGGRTWSTSRRAGRSPAARRSHAIRSSPSTSWPYGRARPTHLFEGRPARSRAARSWCICAWARPDATAATRCRWCSVRRRWKPADPDATAVRRRPKRWIRPGRAPGEWVGDCSRRRRAGSWTSASPPRPGQHCTHCAFRSACSARPEGRHVVE